MKALILNSGLGSRMGVLTSEHPKCMTEISPRETILSRQLRQLAEAGIRQAVITTGYYDTVLTEYCRSLDLPLEYNLYGLEKKERSIVRGLGYPVDAFWQIAAAEGCTAIVGLDAHTPAQFDRPARFDAAKAYLRGLGVRVLDALPGLDAPPKP